VWAQFESIERIGTAADPAGREPGGFWAYFHRPVIGVATKEETIR
jgi:hypothetical protein